MELGVNVDDDVLDIKNINISPFGILLKGTANESMNEMTKLPAPTVIVVFDDGTVTDMAGKRGGSDPDGDGAVRYHMSYSSRGILLDAREITELRIGDTVIPVN